VRSTAGTWRRSTCCSSRTWATSVCPSSYDLGEDLRVVLHAVTEGEDKPLKYPTIFNSADLAVITKIDLAHAVGFDRAEAYRNIREVRPDAAILETSARSGEGMADWLRLLSEGRRSAASAR
jgi:hydrogenase nickel incorporation protein HypB